MIDYQSPLNILIQHCITVDSHLHEAAWKEFFRRYKEKIYQIILYRCRSWHMDKLSNQLKDIVNDIVSEVFVSLPSALANFKNINDEKSFLAFLGTICNRTVSRYLKKYSYEFVLEDDTAKNMPLENTLAYDNRWELFDFITKSLTSVSSQKRFAARDLCLFLFSAWASFSLEEIRKLYCFQNISYKIIDNVISRSRKTLKSNN